MIGEFVRLAAQSDVYPPDFLDVMLPRDDDEWEQVGTVAISTDLPERLTVHLHRGVTAMMREEGDLDGELADLAAGVLLEAMTIDPSLTSACKIEVYERGEDGERYLMAVAPLT